MLPTNLQSSIHHQLKVVQLGAERFKMAYSHHGHVGILDGSSFRTVDWGFGSSSHGPLHAGLLGLYKYSS